MTLAYWCVLAAALVPYVFIVYAKMTPKFVKGDHNKNPREYEAALEGPRQRAHWAQLNGFETYPPFAAAVIIAHLAGAPQATLDMYGVAFVGFRLAHGVFYIVNWDKLRSLAFTGGVVCVVGLFVLAAG